MKKTYYSKSIKSLFNFFTFSLFLLLTFSLLTVSCRTDDEERVGPSTERTDTTTVVDAQVTGFYLLNEGNMGMNKCTLDYYDATIGQYTRNIYAEANPTVVQELGDVGNDLAIYDGKLWAVVNCSHLVEVMDARNARHLGQVSIPNCRYIAFKDHYAYVSSYAGPVLIDPNARLGYVAKIDTRTLQVVDSCNVGYQPEQMAVVGNKLYVANSGGYRVPQYDHTVSVIDLPTFRVETTLDVAPNLHRVVADAYGQVWVSSRGDYLSQPSCLSCINSQDDTVGHRLDLSTSNMTLSGDSLFVIGSEWSNVTNKNTVGYAIVNVRTHQIVTRSFITDGTDAAIKVPYGIAVNPDTKDIYITDAGNYVSPGQLYCFTPDGRLKWKVRTGDIPAHFAFTTSK